MLQFLPFLSFSVIGKCLGPFYNYKTPTKTGLKCLQLSFSDISIKQCPEQMHKCTHGRNKSYRNMCGWSNFLSNSPTQNMFLVKFYKLTSGSQTNKGACILRTVDGWVSSGKHLSSDLSVAVLSENAPNNFYISLKPTIWCSHLLLTWLASRKEVRK